MAVLDVFKEDGFILFGYTAPPEENSLVQNGMVACLDIERGTFSIRLPKQETQQFSSWEVWHRTLIGPEQGTDLRYLTMILQHVYGASVVTLPHNIDEVEHQLANRTTAIQLEATIPPPVAAPAVESTPEQAVIQSPATTTTTTTTTPVEPPKKRRGRPPAKKEESSPELNKALNTLANLEPARPFVATEPITVTAEDPAVNSSVVEFPSLGLAATHLENASALLTRAAAILRAHENNNRKDT